MSSSKRLPALIAAAALALAAGAGVASAETAEPAPGPTPEGSISEPAPGETSYPGWALCVFLDAVTASANPTPMPINCLTPTVAGSIGSVLDPMDASSMEATGS